MPMSSFYRSIRDRIGSSLLLIPAVVAIIRDETGRVLLQQRHDRSWSLPAGAIEPGESSSAAVVREVFEETGLQVRPSRITAVVGGSACRVRYPNGDEVEYVGKFIGSNFLCYNSPNRARSDRWTIRSTPIAWIDQC